MKSFVQCQRFPEREAWTEPQLTRIERLGEMKAEERIADSL